MKHLEVQTREYILLREGFRQWLISLGYAKTTVYNMPNGINELLYHLEVNKVTSINEVTPEHINNFWNELKERPNERRGGGLSSNYLKKFDQAMKNFNKYLLASKGITLTYHFDIPVNEDVKHIIYLTKEEIALLYDSIDSETIMGARDKAMIAVYYGCGLRRHEGEMLNVKDIKLETNMIHVIEGKGYKERLVPMAKGVVEDVKDYLLLARSKLLREQYQQAFFINEKGNRLSGQGMYVRVKQLVKQTPIIKKVGLHTLRHSIATHLLQNGMTLEQIGKFLGHGSLEATQIYTHILDEEF